MTVPSSPAFESWLLVERHRVSAAIEARLHQAAVALLASGRAAEAIAFASRAVGATRSTRAITNCWCGAWPWRATRTRRCGRSRYARTCCAATSASAVSAALREAATVAVRLRHGAGPPVAGRRPRASSTQAGPPSSRAPSTPGSSACAGPSSRRALRDAALQARALAALGGALVHAVRGRDEEGGVVLHEAIGLATQAGDRATAVTAYRELGFVEVQAGRRATADGWLATAQALAETDDELAAVLAIRGMNASDNGDYPAAFAYLDESVERARAAPITASRPGRCRSSARAHLLRGEHSQATAALARSLELVHEQRWMAFLPWPQALRAELDLRAGDLDAAADGFERVLGAGLPAR